MLATTRRPSPNTLGKWENLLSIRTTSATALVAAEPLLIAIPKSAFFNAKASLTPSPVIATTSPSCCNAGSNLTLLLRLNSPKNVMVANHFQEFGWSFIWGQAIHEHQKSLPQHPPVALPPPQCAANLPRLS